MPDYKAEFDGRYYCRNGFLYERQEIYGRFSGCTFLIGSPNL